MLSFDSCGDRPLVMIVDDDEFMLEFISDTLVKNTKSLA